MSISSFAPNGFLPCDGSGYAVGEYPEVFNTIGYNFGDFGDGNYYLLPNFENRMPKGVYPGEIGGSERILLRETHIPPHTHLFTVERYINGSYTYPYYYSSLANAHEPINFAAGYIFTDAPADGYMTIETTFEGDITHIELMPSWYALNFIICANGTGCGTPCPLR
jgi:microcystin-dependent protein